MTTPLHANEVKFNWIETSTLIQTLDTSFILNFTESRTALLKIEGITFLDYFGKYRVTITKGHFADWILIREEVKKYFIGYNSEIGLEK